MYQLGQEGAGGQPQGIPTGIPDFDQIRANFHIEVSKKLALRKLEWLYPIPARISVPALGNGTPLSVDIKRDAHFECFFISGAFTTLNVAGADDGVNHISIRISDGSNDLRLMDDFIPANLFLSPGRQLSSGVAGNPSQQLFYPWPFYHLFPANGAIVVETANNGQTANILDLLFWGKKLRAAPEGLGQQ